MHGLGRTACIRCRKKAKNTSDAGYYIAMGNAASTVDEQFLCGVQLWKLKQYSDAIKLFQLASDGDHPQAMYLMGIAYFDVDCQHLVGQLL